MRSQTEQLRDLMGAMWVTPYDALQATRCLRLAARVKELRESGVNIVARWETLGNGKRVKAYRIAGSWQEPH